MGSAHASDKSDPAAYLAAERSATDRHELIVGYVVAMAEGSLRHSEIAMQAGALLLPAARANGCRVAGPDAKVVSADAQSYVYPDVLVYCGEPQFADGQADVLQNPALIVEVLSPSTEARDRSTKAEIYRALPSLHTYVLIAQDRPHVEWYERQGAFWRFQEASGRNAVAELALLPGSLPLAALYDGIDFSGGPEPAAEG